MIRILSDTCRKLNVPPATVFGLAVDYLRTGDDNPAETGLLAYRAWCNKVGDQLSHKARYLDDQVCEADVKLPEWVEDYCLSVLTSKIKLLEHKKGCRRAS